MARATSKYWGSQTHEQALRRPTDPYLRLAFSVVKRATTELKESDPLYALPALCWWLEDAQDWLAILDLCDPGDASYFSKLIEGCKNGKKRKADRHAAQGN